MEVGAKLLAQSQLLWCAIKNHGDHDKYYHLQKQLHSERGESAWVVISVIVGKMIPPAPIPSNSPGTARTKLKMGYFLEQCIKMIPLSSDTFKQPFFRIPCTRKKKMKFSLGATCRDDTALLWYLQTPQFLCTSLIFMMTKNACIFAYFSGYTELYFSLLSSKAYYLTTMFICSLLGKSLALTNSTDLCRPKECFLYVPYVLYVITKPPKQNYEFWRHWQSCHKYGLNS